LNDAGSCVACVNANTNCITSCLTAGFYNGATASCVACGNGASVCS